MGGSVAVISTANLVQTCRSGFFATAVCRPYDDHFAGLNRAPWGRRPPWGGDSIAVQIKQIWYVGNVTMTVISVGVGTRNLRQY